jgi:cyclopropane fatty-acyl-phospholipid synthase-like methyltransferase
MDFFERQWSSYRAVVEHDLMEHRAAAAAAATTLHAWLAQRPAAATAPALIDLGCGDLARMAPLLRELPLSRYTGLDLAAVVLPLAQQALGPVGYATHWREGDLLGWAEAQDGADPALDQPDILHSAFAIHHLSEAQKCSFLEGARRRIQPGGLFIWVDVFREPDESRDAYIARYCQRISSSWPQLNAKQQEHVIAHLSQFDLPADRASIQQSAEAAGWRWEWAWQGQHRAEAMAVLAPA